VFDPALKTPNSLLSEAEASEVSAFRTKKFGRRKSICRKFNSLISIFLILFFLTISIFALKISKIYIEANSCVGCGDCVLVCPIVDAIEIIDGKAVIDIKVCIECDICVKSCTYNAIRKSE